MRRFNDALQGERCQAVITLRDGSTADCGRKATIGTLCTQHAKIANYREVITPLDSCSVYVGEGNYTIVELCRVVRPGKAPEFTVASRWDGGCSNRWYHQTEIGARMNYDLFIQQIASSTLTVEG